MTPLELETSMLFIPKYQEKFTQMNTIGLVVTYKYFDAFPGN